MTNRNESKRYKTLLAIPRLSVVATLSLSLVGAIAWPSLDDIKIGKAIDIGSDVVKTVSLSDGDVKQMAGQYAGYSDSRNKLAPSSNPYAQRLAKLTQKHLNEDGLKLNFKVYISSEVNAFSLADGTIRFNSAILDLMNDDEVLSIVGHEIGHIKEGHSKSKMRMAYASSAARKTVAAQSNTAGVLASGQIGALGEELLNKQFSQSEEKSADDYALKFLKKHGYNQKGIVSAFRKLAKQGGKHGLFSTHPDPEVRATRLEKKIK